MEHGYLIDTNIAIGYLNNTLPEKQVALIEQGQPSISVITRMEMLAWPKATAEQRHTLQLFIEASIVYGLDEPVIVHAIELRRMFKIKLPDAIVAATAMVHQLTLMTFDVGFAKVPDLSIIGL